MTDTAVQLFQAYFIILNFSKYLDHMTSHMETYTPTAKKFNHNKII
jgi:hypothetical protein